MRIIVKKAYPKPRSKKLWPVNQVLVVTQEEGTARIKAGQAEEYKGVFPPSMKQKVKMNLSQLKN